MTEWLSFSPEGERVRLRPPGYGDEPALIEMATDPHVRSYIGGPIDPTVAAANAMQKISAQAWGQFVIVGRVSGEVVGSGSLARKRGPWEVSYQLRRAYWGHGLAGEAVELIRVWFFENLDENLLIATTQRANDRSKRLLSRAGAVFAGTFEQYGLVQERFEFHRGGHPPLRPDA
ncbi:GNAT family N-acetyltransferase [Micromonospora tarensis]|uniref:GNAT family N-acetyltransferase n=1 Tax=Micromonospora tarensis TaxID=2806100 RepID=A0ABS1Y9E2_9ACTN|nr:GNAT family N-acetyltransferase [Micromonospora tarensis]MBM0273959.1 GNAT family N-acetyltransferase [Micromonospora tarensis]